MGNQKTNGTTEGTETQTAAAPARTMLGPLDVQQKEFRVSRFGGYKMRDVDEFLDTVTDSMSALVAEVDRLRKGAPAPMVGAPDLADVSRQADEIIERARTEAARIVAEAKVAGAAEASMPEDRAAVNAFLTKEREFLQSLAGLVQGHAETVKGMSKAARKPATTQPASEERGADSQPEAASAAEPSPAVIAAEKAPETPEPTKPAPASAAPPREATAVQEPVTPAPEAPTKVPESDAAVRVGESKPAASRDDDADGGDRSLRDLFWGED